MSASSFRKSVIVPTPNGDISFPRRTGRPRTSLLLPPCLGPPLRVAPPLELRLSGGRVMVRPPCTPATVVPRSQHRRCASRLGSAGCQEPSQVKVEGLFRLATSWAEHWAGH